nr:D-allose transporter subunit [Klebsiella pneumoniae]
MVVSLIPAFALLSIPAALMLGLLLGLFNGALVAFAGLPPFIVTLGTYTAARRRLSAGRRHHGDQLRYQLRVDRQ